MTSKNPAQTAAPLHQGERVQPDCPLSGEVQRGGMLVLIHPRSGDMFVAKRGEGALARHMILAGYNPIGPRGQAAAAVIRARVA